MKSVLIINSNNNVIQQYNIEDGEIQEITLVGDWTKNGNTFTYDESFDGTTVYYTDSNGENQNILLNDDIYINGSLSVSYTGQQDLLLTDTSLSCVSGSIYLPTFEITGTIQDVSSSGNIFNNFAENSIKFTLSNIPSYIQYVIMFMLLLFILGFIRKFKRR